MLLENTGILENIEMYVLLFFTYAISGWLMESVGGIFKVKKFINRGFLIGPYCPVYGVGVVIITLLLGNYKNDIPVLFVLSTVICGTLEYATSYIMEKLFNARWWDYHNRRFNINGRICLETLLPFGIAGSMIICFINPFFINVYSQIPDLVRHIITGVLVVLYIIDIIISFTIILSFKGETYKEKDNTEEISSKVKEKTEDIIMQAESDAIVFGRKLKVSGLKLQRKVRYTRKQLSDVILYSPEELAKAINKQREEINNKINEEKEKISSQIKLRRVEFEMKQKESKEIFDNQIRKKISEFENLQKISKEKMDNTIKNIKNTSEEITKQVKENFKSKSLLRKRLIEAFPDLEVKIKENKNRNNNNKIKK